MPRKFRNRIEAGQLLAKQLTPFADRSDVLVLHFDHTRAVEPLERSVEWEAGEVDETFPTGV